MVVANELLKGDSLRRGEHIISSDHHFTLIHQYDGNVVLYETESRKALWSTDTYGEETTSLIMQHDANLVLYTKGGKPIWASDTARSGADKAVMQTDGNFVMYDGGRVKWATDTDVGIKLSCEYYVNESMLEQDKLTSPNGKHQLRFEDNGNVALFTYGRRVWETCTCGSGANILALQIDGNMVLYNDKKAVWASNTYKEASEFARMQDDGNFVIYTKEEKVVWASNAS